MEEKKNEIILFENQGVKLEVNLKDETVWLAQAQMSELFKKAKTKDEQDFYMALSNIMLQKQQSKVIGK